MVIIKGLFVTCTPVFVELSFSQCIFLWILYRQICQIWCSWGGIYKGARSTQGQRWDYEDSKDNRSSLSSASSSSCVCRNHVSSDSPVGYSVSPHNSCWILKEKQTTSSLAEASFVLHWLCRLVGIMDLPPHSPLGSPPSPLGNLCWGERWIVIKLHEKTSNYPGCM